MQLDEFETKDAPAGLREHLTAQEHGCLVICRDDDGEYALATRQIFSREGAEIYAAQCAKAREAIVVRLVRPTTILRGEES